VTGGAPPGARGNGVPVTSWWAALGTCDPRVTGDVLLDLASAGIAAYAQPDGGTRGSYLELRPPHRPMDHLYVEGNRLSEAAKLVGDHLGDRPGSEDAAFEAIVAGFHDAPAEPSWPASEDATAPPGAPDQPPATYQRTIRLTPRTPEPPGLLDPGGVLGDRLPGADPFEGDDEHFERPKLDKPKPVATLTRLACVAIVAGVALILAPAVWGFSDATLADTLGVALVVAGVVRLLGRLKEEPPDDEDRFDDGAVV